MQPLPKLSGAALGTLFILPLIYALLSYLFYSQTKYIYTTNPDPAYVYLLNGTNLAGGNLEIGHFDHPGTPVQLLAAVIIFLTSLFLGHGAVYESVLSNPEMYLAVCAFVLISLMLFSVYKSGALVYRHTGNIIQALFFQLLPIVSYTAIHHFILLKPEVLIVIILNYYCAYLWVLFYYRSQDPDNDFSKKNQLLFFSFITALLITAKINCIPFLLIPFFVIRKFSRKIIYLILTFIFMLALVFPIWPKLPLMFKWMSALVMHSGTYGTGTAEITNFGTFKYNLTSLFEQEYFFMAGYLLITIAFVTGLFSKKIKGSGYYSLGAILWLVITIMVVITAKHYKYYYLIPGSMLLIPAFMAFFVSFLNEKTDSKMRLTAFILIAGWLCYHAFVSATVFKNGNTVVKTIENKSTFDSLPRIITTGSENSAFIESAIHFGVSYSGNCQTRYYSFLQKLYPRTYFFLIGENVLNFWGQPLDLSELAKVNSRVLVYFHTCELPPGAEEAAISKLTEGYEGLVRDFKLEYANAETGEKIYILTFDTDQKSKVYRQKLEFTCGMEKTMGDEIRTSVDSIRLKGAGDISGEKFYSGKPAVKLSPGHQYSGIKIFQANPGDVFDIEVLCQSNDHPCALVLDAHEVNFYKSSEFPIETLNNGWKKVKLRTELPFNFRPGKISFYLFYSGPGVCYADDLKFTLLKK